MKLTTKQLKQMIKEELSSVLIQEYEDDSYEDPEEPLEGIPQIGDEIPENQEMFMQELKDKNLLDSAFEDAYDLLFDYDEDYPDDPRNYSDFDPAQLTLNQIKHFRDIRLFESLLARQIVANSETFSGRTEKPIGRYREILPAGSVVKKYAYSADMDALRIKLENSEELRSKVYPIYNFLEDFKSGKIMGASGPLLPDNFVGSSGKFIAKHKLPFVKQIFELWRSMNGV